MVEDGIVDSIRLVETSDRGNDFGAKLRLVLWARQDDGYVVGVQALRRKRECLLTNGERV